jgi:4-alpha-glucanotransferase
LRDDFELPGMHVLQFLDLDRTDCPHRMSGHKEHGIAYLGTHDNEPSSTWWERLSPAVRKRMTSELGIEDSAGQLSQALNRSRCRLAVHTVQDLMGLDASSRLNQPGVPKGQWTWRFEGSWPDRQLPLRRA